MPIYQDKECHGACENFGLPCVRPEHYVEVAERYNAQPVAPSGNLIVDGRDVPWSYWTLNIQSDDRERALDDLVAEDKRRSGENKYTDDEVRLWAQAWLKEAPCYFCDVTICGYCGNQHERYMIHDGTCDVKLSIESEQEEE